MAPITEHQVINTYFDLNLGTRFRSKPNRFDLGCIEVFANFGTEIDLSTPEKLKAIQPYILHYKYIVTKVQKLIKNGRDHVLTKFPDKTKPFYLPSTNDIFVKSAPMETDEYDFNYFLPIGFDFAVSSAWRF